MDPSTWLSPWVSGVSQEVVGGLLTPLIIATVAFMIGRARGKGWQWVAPILYALVSGVSLYLLLFGLLAHGEMPPRWWGFGVLLAFMLCVVWYVDKRSRAQVALPLAQETPRDIENKEKIVVLFRAHGGPASGDLQQIARSLTEQFRQFRGSETKFKTHRVIAQLVHSGPYMAWGQADSRIRRAVDGSDKVDGSELQNRLGEFFCAYQGLVRWVIHLDDFQSEFVATSKEPVTRFKSVIQGREFESWQEKHKLFHQELRKLLAVDDFSQLDERLSGAWSDTFD